MSVGYWYFRITKVSKFSAQNLFILSVNTDARYCYAISVHLSNAICGKTITYIVKLFIFCMVWPVLTSNAITTSCASGDTICLRPLQIDNIFAFIHQVAPVSACWLFKTSATS